jgi:hypothetical protein
MSVVRNRQSREVAFGQRGSLLRTVQATTATLALSKIQYLPPNLASSSLCRLVARRFVCGQHISSLRTRANFAPSRKFLPRNQFGGGIYCGRAHWTTARTTASAHSTLRIVSANRFPTQSPSTLQPARIVASGLFAGCDPVRTLARLKERWRVGSN